MIEFATKHEAIEAGFIPAGNRVVRQHEPMITSRDANSGGLGRVNDTFELVEQPWVDGERRPRVLGRSVTVYLTDAPNHGRTAGAYSSMFPPEVVERIHPAFPDELDDGTVRLIPWSR